jgi:c(7)-type cytochrome triheme protein
MSLLYLLSKSWRLVFSGAVLCFFLPVAANFLSVSQAPAGSGQPLEFNHKVMVGLGIDCLFCHTDAMRSPAAGMPSVEKCMGCHQLIATNQPVIQELAGYWERQEPIPWERVYQIPRFVYFSHRVHVVAGGLNCERCHGDVSQMTVAEEVVRMNMGWCLSCHDRQDNAAQLRDCVVCHQ